MAYDQRGLTLGRGRYNNLSLGDLSAATHVYTSTDNSQTIQTAAYFPDNLGVDAENLKAGDVLVINSANGQSSHKISTLAPFALSTAAGGIAGGEDYGFATALQGPYSSSQAITFVLTKSGNAVTLQIPNLTSAANSSSTITTTTAVGTVLRPVVDQIMPCVVTDNVTVQFGVVAVRTNGTFEFSADAADGTAFANAGTPGVGPSTVTYLVNS